MRPLREGHVSATKSGQREYKIIGGSKLRQLNLPLLALLPAPSPLQSSEVLWSKGIGGSITEC